MRIFKWLKSFFRRAPAAPTQVTCVDGDAYQQAVVEEVFRTGGPVHAVRLDDGRLEIHSAEGTRIIDPRKE